MKNSYDPIYDLDTKGILQYHNCELEWLVIDYCEKIVPGQCAKASKYFSPDEWFFRVHFKDDPNVPSSIQIEVMSQTMVMTFLTIPGYEKTKTTCLKLNNIEFTRKIIPGDKLVVCATLKSFNRGMAVGRTEGYVNEKYTCGADFIICIPEEISKFVPRK